METIETPSVDRRIRWILSTAWDACIRRIASGRIAINKESSLQLHYAYVLAQVGELACVDDGERFRIGLETHHGGKNIDIWCSLGSCEAAIELKCFRKASNRATDIDMYDALKDIARLESYSHVAFRRFICLTDNEFYTKFSHRGHAGSVSIGDGKRYDKGFSITPTWAGRWQDRTRDTDIVFKTDIEFAWCHIGGWYYLFIDV